MALIIYIVTLKHIRKKWKYQYRLRKLREKERTKRTKILSEGFVHTTQSNDWVKRVMAIFSSNRLLPFDRHLEKKRKLTEKYEETMTDMLDKELDEISPRENAPVRKQKKSKRIKSPQNEKGVKEN